MDYHFDNGLTADSDAHIYFIVTINIIIIMTMT